MVKQLDAKMSYKLSDADRKLYDKYGVPASELEAEGEHLAAVKLIDKIVNYLPLKRQASVAGKLE